MFCKDSRTENFLTQMGVEFRYTNSVSFSELVPQWDSHNLARPVPRRDDAILEYASLMESGSAAPAPILHDCGSGYDVLDGVQRLAAAKLSGAASISAYIVTCDSDDVLASIRVLANARLQGRPEPPEWTRRRAVEILVLQRSMSPAEVARMGGWKKADIEYIARVLDWGFQIRCIGGPNLPDTVVDYVASRTTQDELKKAAAPIAEFFNAVKASQLSASDAEQFIDTFFLPVARNAHETYGERLKEFLSDPEIETRIHGRRSSGMSRDINLRRVLKSAITILESIEAEGSQLRNVDEFFKLTKQINERLHGISKAHQKPATARVPADLYRKEQ